jgi:hypothetical protein
MGRVLSRSVTATIHDWGHAGNWVAEFSKSFIQEAGITADSYIAVPDKLSHSLTQAVKTLRESLHEDGLDRSSWAFTIAESLERNAAPVFERRERPTPEAATAIRLAALSLAGEADGLGQRDAGDMFREVAAGITLLERRASGEELATEIILLAAE